MCHVYDCPFQIFIIKCDMNPSVAVKVFHCHTCTLFPGVFIQLVLGLFAIELYTIESGDGNTLISPALLFLLEAD